LPHIQQRDPGHQEASGYCGERVSQSIGPLIGGESHRQKIVHLRFG